MSAPELLVDAPSTTPVADVLLLHPLGADHRFFDPVLPFLPGYRVIRCDLPGHGTTARAPEPTLAAIAAELESALRGAGVAPQVVVGVSLGGLVAQELAVRAHDLVRALVLADTVAVYPDPMREQWRTRAAALESGSATVLDYLDPTLGVWFDDEAPPAARDYVAEVLATTSPQGYAAACRALESADTTSYAPRLAVPTAVACGREDGPAFREAVDWFCAHLPDAHARWLPHRHATAMQAPAAFADVIAEIVGHISSTTEGGPLA